MGAVASHARELSLRADFGRRNRGRAHRHSAGAGNPPPPARAERETDVATTPTRSVASRATIRLLLPVAAAFAAWSLWLGEVFWINGARLSAFNWSALPICLLIVGVSSYVVTERAPWRGRIAFIGSSFCLTLGAAAPRHLSRCRWPATIRRHKCTGNGDPNRSFRGNAIV